MTSPSQSPNRPTARGSRHLASSFSSRGVFILFFSIFLSAFTLLCTSSPFSTANAQYVQTTFFKSTLYPTLTRSTDQYYVGQEVRLKLEALNPSANTALNRSSVRVVIAALYPNRAASGIPVPCNSTSSDVYFNSGNLGIKTYANNGNLARYAAYEAYVTFSIPPFPWRICVLNKPKYRSQYYPIEGQNTVYPRRFNQSRVYFHSSSAMQQGDFATMSITRVGLRFPYAPTVPSTVNWLDGDSVKLVPAGYPCAAEGLNSRDTRQPVDYCGSNMVNDDGSWRSERCLLENSVTGGVAKLGTNATNPHLSAIAMARGLTGAERIVAYLQLPTYGNYEVCYSPLEYRKRLVRRREALAQPMWFKIMQYSDACNTAAGCSSRTILQVLPRVGTVTWSSLGTPVAGSFGSIRVRGPEGLSSSLATKWDPKCPACTKEYFETLGGDAFRLVHIKHFAAPEPSTPGNSKIAVTGPTTQWTFGSTKTVIEAGSTPSMGTSLGGKGCWVSDDDNYGTLETPMGIDRCATCETGSQGQTASGDLGGDPRSGEASYLQNLDNQFLVFARVRIPRSAGTWRVCYRQKGVKNWQYLDWDTLVAKPYFGFFQTEPTNMNILLPAQMNTNYTYFVNDTRAGTWAQVEVRSTSANMETTTTTFFSSTTAQSLVRGAMLKFVDNNKRCDDPVLPHHVSLTGGTPACLPLRCGFQQGACPGCAGSKDETSALRNLITFHAEIPANLTNVRVCFRNRVENWRVITPRRIRTPLLPVRPAPSVTYTISDTRQGSWGRFILSNSNGNPIDSSPFYNERGNMFRLVPVTSRCDLVWTDGTGEQDYSNATVDSNFGVSCPTANAGVCAASLTSPTASGIVGTAPYTDMNPDGNGFVSAAVAFAQLPNTSTVAHRVCFREGRGNWFELSPQLTPAASPTYRLSNVLPSYTAGSYASFTVVSTAANLAVGTASFKIVEFERGCQAPALGTYAVSGLDFISFSAATSFGSRTETVGTAGPDGYAALKFFITMPTLRETPTGSPQLKLRRVCFAPVATAARNWVDLGSIRVVAHDIGYTVNEAPVNGKQFTLTVISTTALMDGYAGDALKVVPLASPCGSEESAGGSMPSDVTSHHAGMEIRNSGYASASNLTKGVTYLGGPTTTGTLLQVSVKMTLPGTRTADQYRVCYKRAAGTWMELLQVPLANRVYNLGPSGFVTTVPNAPTLTVNSKLVAVSPSSSFTYAGVAYSNFLMAGASTAYNNAGTLTYYFTATGVGLQTSDVLRVIQVNKETQVLGTYSTVQAVSCEDPAAANYIYRTVSPSTVVGNVANFQFSIPIDAGRYFFCYQLGGAGTWYQPAHATYNPTLVLSTMIYLRLNGQSSLDIGDGSQSMGANLGSLATTDKVYLAVANQLCGIGTAYTGASADAAAVGLTGTGVDANSVYNLLTLNSPSWYPITTSNLYFACYRKTVTTKTSESSTIVPILTSEVWYHVPFYLDGVFRNSYRVLINGARLVSQCPVGPLTAGVSFDATVRAEDPDTLQTITSSTPRVFSAKTDNAWTLWDESGVCPSTSTFFRTTSGKDGTTTFKLSPKSVCPAGGCTMHFESQGMTSSSPCTFSVTTSYTVSSITATAPATCQLGKTCTLTVTAKDSNGAVIYVSNDAITLSLVNPLGAGLGLSVNSAAAASTIDSTGLALVSGTASIQFSPVALSAASWPVTSASYNVELSVTVGGQSSAVTFAVNRPSLNRLAVTALTPVLWNGDNSNDVDMNMIPRWEASTTHSAGFWDWQALPTTLQAGSTYPLVAGRYYKATLVALDAQGSTITDPTFFSGAQLGVSLSTTSGNGTNVLIGQPPNSDIHSYLTPIATRALSQTTTSVIFRFKNADGCSRVSPCSVVFTPTVPSAPTPPVASRITSSVRSRAIRLIAYCASSEVTTLFSPTCPSSTSVEKGVRLHLQAVDQFGFIDEFFNANLHAGVLLNNLTAQGYNVTTVSNLLLNTVAFPPTRFSNGELRIDDLTLNAPCDECVLQFFTEWNVGYAYMPIRVIPSTVRLNAVLSLSNGPYFNLNTAKTAVRDTYTGGASTDLLVYPSTDLCFDITAINAAGSRTLYENTYVFYSVASLGSEPLRINPANKTNFRSAPLLFSNLTLCVNVVYADDSSRATTPFTITFYAQQVRPYGHWSSYPVTSTFTTGTFYVQVSRLIGGLRVTSVTGLTLVPGGSTSSLVWGRAQLTDVNAQLTVKVDLSMVDHYGKTFTSTQLHSTQSSFYVSPGTCTSSEVSSGQCFGTGSSSHKLVVDPLLPVREGGAVSVVLQTASYSLINPALSFTFNVKRWCLRCDVPLYLFDSQGQRFSDVVRTSISSTLRLSILMPTSAPTSLNVGFRVGNSPYAPTSGQALTSTYWRHWLATATNRPSTSNGRPVLFNSACFNGSLTNCKPNTNLFMYSACASDSREVLTGKDDAPMKFVVYRSTQGMTYGEPVCTGDCFTGTNQATSQMDIFTNYTFNLTVGTQNLKCANSVCTGDNSGTITVQVNALGNTVDEALLALTSVNSAPSTSLSVVGVSASTYAPIDPVTGAMTVGGGDASRAGPLRVEAMATNRTINPLTSVSGDTAADQGLYYLMWRGPSRATQMAILNSARASVCPNEPTYQSYVASTAPNYNGYAVRKTLKELAVAHSGAVIPINEPFPFTIEIQDTNGNVVPSATGTIAVTIVDWAGCGNGGTATVVGSNTILDGRALLWVKFSESCESCTVRFDLTPDSSQGSLYELLKNSVQKQSIEVRNLVIRGSLQGTAVNVIATTDPALQDSAVSIDTAISVTVQAVSNLAGLSISDAASTVQVYAFNDYHTETDSLSLYNQAMGDGGILRLSSQTVNYVPTAVTASGTGSATLSFSFQRTCQFGCRVRIVWYLPATNTRGSFLLANKNGNQFIVSAPIQSPRLFNSVMIRKTIRYNAPFPFSVWTAMSSATVPFAGWSTSAAPTVATPAITVSDSAVGTSGTMSVNLTQTARSVTYHLNFSEPCYACDLALGSTVSLSIAIQPTATHLRVSSLSPASVALGDAVSATVYASDDAGYRDFTVGGQNRCPYVIPFLCSAAGEAVEIIPSQTGRVLRDFAPTTAAFHVGGTNGFLLTATGGTSMRDGTTTVQFKPEVTPALAIRPVFRVNRTTGNLDTASYPVPAVRVTQSVSSANVSVYTPLTGFSLYENFTLSVAMTAFDPTTSNNYVISNANTAFLLTYTDCKVTLHERSAYQRSVNGVATFNISFNEVSSCVFTVTYIFGTIPCTRCSVTHFVGGSALVATSWDYIRPSYTVQPGTTNGMINAAMMRSQYLKIQLWNLVNGRRKAQSCQGCQILFQDRSCSPRPTISPSGGAAFDSNGVATVRMGWSLSRDPNKNSTIQSYSCNVVTSISGSSLDGPQGSQYAFSVCYPDHLVLLNQTRDADFLRRRLRTRKAYTFAVGVFDMYGVPCPGDSHFEAGTRVSVSLVHMDGTAVSSDIQVINVNRTSQSDDALSRSYNNTVYLLDGAFYFSLVFTNASTVPLRLRFEGYSAQPRFTNILYSNPFFIDAEPARLYIQNKPPVYVSSERQYSFDLLLTDLVPQDYLEDNARTPNIYPLSTIDYKFIFFPSFYDTTAVTFVSGTDRGMLVDGKRSFTLRFNIPPGEYSFYFQSLRSASVLQYAPLMRTEVVRIVVQKPVRMAFVTVRFYDTASYVCNTNCFMPVTSTAFTYDTNTAQMTITTPKTFQYAVVMLDANDQIITSETGLSVSCRVVPSNSATTANIAFAPSLVQTGPLVQPLTNGMANFSIGFVGGTDVSGTSHPVQIECSCSGSSCPSVPVATTLPIHVTATSTTPVIDDTIDNNLIFKIPTTLDSLDKFNMTSFILKVVRVLNQNNIKMIQLDNANKSLPLSVCLVHRQFFGYSDLRKDVCGPTNKCTYGNNNTCPLWVYVCLCSGQSDLPATAAHHFEAQARHLGQTAATGAEVQAELGVTLKYAPAFQPTSEDQVKAQYLSISQTMYDSLSAPSSSTWTEFQPVTDTIVVSSSSTVSVPATQTPVPVPPATAVELTPAPAAGSSTVVMWSIVLAYLVALLAQQR
jgi:hypothetical protein